MSTKPKYPMDVSQDEQRLLRFYRCLKVEQQDEILHQIASQVVEDLLDPELTVNGFTALIPEPPDVYSRGSIWEEHTIDHLLYCAIEATGDPQLALLGSSQFDDEENIPRFCGAARREAERRGDYWFDSSVEFAKNVLNEWRFAIVIACENAFQAKIDEESR